MSQVSNQTNVMEKNESGSGAGSSRFEAGSACLSCGLCCLNTGVPPYDEHEREFLKENIPHVYDDLLAVEETRKTQLRLYDLPSRGVYCGFFDLVTRKCRHHEHNPRDCRLIEVGDESCDTNRHVANLPLVKSNERTTLPVLNQPIMNQNVHAPTNDVLDSSVLIANPVFKPVSKTDEFDIFHFRAVLDQRLGRVRDIYLAFDREHDDSSSVCDVTLIGQHVKRIQISSTCWNRNYLATEVVAAIETLVGDLDFGSFADWEDEPFAAVYIASKSSSAPTCHK